MVVPAVVTDFNRRSVGNDYPVTPMREAVSTSNVLEVPSIFVGGREFSITAYQAKASSPVHPRQSKLPPRLAYQRPIIDMTATKSMPVQQAAAQPLYIVQEKPQRRGWRRLVSHVFGGLHDRWISWRSRSNN